jgi:hypothetical protein
MEGNNTVIDADQGGVRFSMLVSEVFSFPSVHDHEGTQTTT